MFDKETVGLYTEVAGIEHLQGSISVVGYADRQLSSAIMPF